MSASWAHLCTRVTHQVDGRTNERRAMLIAPDWVKHIFILKNNKCVRYIRHDLHWINMSLSYLIRWNYGSYAYISADVPLYRSDQRTTVSLRRRWGALALNRRILDVINLTVIDSISARRHLPVLSKTHRYFRLYLIFKYFETIQFGWKPLNSY